jgi:hypothetical protein
MNEAAVPYFVSMGMPDLPAYSRRHSLAVFAVRYRMSTGNHDYGSGPDAARKARELMREDTRRPWSYSQLGPEEVAGVSNYHIEVGPRPSLVTGWLKPLAPYLDIPRYLLIRLSSARPVVRSIEKQRQGFHSRGCHPMQIMGSSGDDVAAVLTSIDTRAFANTPDQMVCYYGQVHACRDARAYTACELQCTAFSWLRCGTRNPLSATEMRAVE